LADPVPKPPLPLIADQELGMAKKASAVLPWEKVQSMFHGLTLFSVPASGVEADALDDWE